MIELCVKRELVVGNILFKKKNIHKYTWMRQDNGKVVDREIIEYGCVGEHNRMIVGCESFERG